MEGYCGATRFGANMANCQRPGSSGAWPLRETGDLKAAAEECLRRCAGCAQCKYISVATERGDCSWFASCDMSKLKRSKRDVSGFVTFMANATIGTSVDGRNKALQRRRRRAERHRAAVTKAGEPLLGGRVPDEEPRQRRSRQGVLVLALGVLSVDSKPEAARRTYLRQTLRPLGRSGLVYKFVIGTRGTGPFPPAQGRAMRETATAGLSREQARQGDLALLPGSRDGSKAYTSEKVLLWLLHARREYPAALFVGKVNPDSNPDPNPNPNPDSNPNPNPNPNSDQGGPGRLHRLATAAVIARDGAHGARQHAAAGWLYATRSSNPRLAQTPG